MNISLRCKKKTKKFRYLSLLMFSLIILTGCSPSPSNDTLLQTQIALGLRQTDEALNAAQSIAETVTAQIGLSLQQTNEAANAAQNIQATVSAQQATIDALMASPASNEITYPTHTEIPSVTLTIVPPATETPSSEPFVLIDWTAQGFNESSSGCYEDDTLCFVAINEQEKLLELNTPISISEGWNNPYLIFRHKLVLPESIQANINIKSSRKWQTVKAFVVGNTSWMRIAIPLEEFRDQEILISFNAPWGIEVTEEKEIWPSRWYFYRGWVLKRYRTEWTISGITIEPDYTPE